MIASVHSSMRTLQVVAAMAILFIAASCLLLWTPIPCLEPPTALAVAQNTSWPPMHVSQSPPTKEPPPSAGGLQFRWDYSDLVCTGLAAEPQRTGIVETVNGVDRDQLAVWVELQTCFKGAQPARKVTVLGDTVFASKDMQGGFVYAGPPTGFVAPGRNLLFLRATKSSVVWRVTLPIYATCLPLADVFPEYGSDGSDDGIRSALVAEIEAAMTQGHLRNDRSAFQALQQSEYVAAIYAPYILEVYGKRDGLNELARIMSAVSLPARRTIAMELLRNGDQRGLPDTLALLQDESAVSWQRANAARALEFAVSPQGREALEALSDQRANDELHFTAREVLARIRRNDQ